MHAHQSNYKIIGFTYEPQMDEICNLAHRFEVPVVDDLGSGAMLDTARFGLAHEPTVQDSLRSGSDVVCFSGDKLLGGPQAGIIVGREDLIRKMKKHPLARAIRADKLCLAGLMATLMHYLKGEAETEIPVWWMISQSQEQVYQRVQHWKEYLHTGEVVSCLETIGGGSMPGETLRGYGLALSHKNPNQALKALRMMNPPIIGRIEEEKILLDGRTVLPDEEDLLLEKMKEFLMRGNH